MIPNTSLLIVKRAEEISDSGKVNGNAVNTMLTLTPQRIRADSKYIPEYYESKDNEHKEPPIHRGDVPPSTKRNS